MLSLSLEKDFTRDLRKYATEMQVTCYRNYSGMHTIRTDLTFALMKGMFQGVLWS